MASRMLFALDRQLGFDNESAGVVDVDELVEVCKLPFLVPRLHVLLRQFNPYPLY